MGCAYSARPNGAGSKPPHLESLFIRATTPPAAPRWNPPEMETAIRRFQSINAPPVMSVRPTGQRQHRRASAGCGKKDSLSPARARVASSAIGLQRHHSHHPPRNRSEFECRGHRHNESQRPVRSRRPSRRSGTGESRRSTTRGSGWSGRFRCPARSHRSRRRFDVLPSRT